VNGSAFLGRFSARFTRGFSRAGVIVGILNILTFAKVWQGTFDYYGIPIIAVVISIPLVFVLACIAIGILEERSGMWGDDTLHIWKVAGWDPVELTEEVKSLKQLIDELRKERNDHIPVSHQG
jgi:hypothetical protein